MLPTYRWLPRREGRWTRGRSDRSSRYSGDKLPRRQQLRRCNRRSDPADAVWRGAENHENCDSRANAYFPPASAHAPPQFWWSACPAVQRYPHALGREWNSTQADAGRVIYRVGERSANRRARGLAGAERRFIRPVDQIYFKFGHVGESQNWITRPVDACYVRAIELHLLEKHPAYGLQNAALDLGANAIGVDDLSAIMGAADTFDLDASARALDRHLHAHRHEGLAVLVVDIGYAATTRDGGFCASARRRPCLPFHHRRHALDQLDAARILETAQAKLDRVDARRCRQLVGEALDRKAIGRLAGRA